MSSLGTEASLIVAAFQLLAVRAVNGASRAADLESGDVVTPTGIVEKPEPAPQLAPQPDAQAPADSYEGPARVEVRLVNQRPPFYTANLPLRNPPRHLAPLRPIIAATCDVATIPTTISINPIEPPWKVLPWMERAAPRYVLIREIKLVAAGSDMSFRGKMLDVVV